MIKGHRCPCMEGDHSCYGRLLGSETPSSRQGRETGARSSGEYLSENSVGIYRNAYEICTPVTMVERPRAMLKLQSFIGAGVQTSCSPTEYRVPFK